MPRVTVICHDSPTRDTCPTLYQSDEGDYYVQGYVVTDADVLAEMTVPEGEAVVRITPELVRMIRLSAIDVPTQTARLRPAQ